MDVGRKYMVIYDDHGFKPLKKIGVVEWIKGNLFKLDSDEEELNLNNIVRAVPLDSGKRRDDAYDKP